MGNELAKNIGASVGTHIKIISPLGTLTPMGRIPRIKNFQVGAIFHSGMFEFDNTLVYASIPRVQDYLGLDDKVTGLEVQVKDIYAADTIAAEIQKKLGPAYQTRDWMRMNRSLFAALKLEKIAMFIILTLIVLVAAFNITSTLIMLVMEKTKDIAILKSMGATRRSIMKIFMLEGLIIGAIGTVIGLALGFLADRHLAALRIHQAAQRCLLYFHLAGKNRTYGRRRDCRRHDTDQLSGHALPVLAGLPSGTGGSDPVRVRQGAWDRLAILSKWVTPPLQRYFRRGRV